MTESRNGIQSEVASSSSLDILRSTIREKSYTLGENSFFQMNDILYQSVSADELAKFGHTLLYKTIVEEVGATRDIPHPMFYIQTYLARVAARSEAKRAGFNRGVYFDNDSLTAQAVISRESRKQGKKSVDILPDLLYVSRTGTELMIVDIDGDPATIVNKVVGMKEQSETSEWEELMAKKRFSEIRGGSPVLNHIQLFVTQDQLDSTAKALEDELLKDIDYENQVTKADSEILSLLGQLPPGKKLNPGQKIFQRTLRATIEKKVDFIAKLNAEREKILSEAGITLNAIPYSQDEVLAMAQGLYDHTVLEVQTRDGRISYLPTPRKLYEVRGFQKANKEPTVSLDNPQNMGVTIAIQRENDTLKEPELFEEEIIPEIQGDKIDETIEDSGQELPPENIVAPKQSPENKKQLEIDQLFKPVTKRWKDVLKFHDELIRKYAKLERISITDFEIRYIPLLREVQKRNEQAFLKEQIDLIDVPKEKRSYIFGVQSTYLFFATTVGLENIRPLTETPDLKHKTVHSGDKLAHFVANGLDNLMKFETARAIYSPKPGYTVRELLTEYLLSVVAMPHAASFINDDISLTLMHAGAYHLFDLFEAARKRKS
ncbi:MAG: hypothetical protein ABIO02_02330 [Patescibacteria group bacterium]